MLHTLRATWMRCFLIVLAAVVGVIPSHGQADDVGSAHRAVVHAEPLAVGIDFGVGLSKTVTLGLDITAGQLFVADIQSSEVGSDVDLAAVAHVMLRVKASSMFSLLVEPIGVSVAVGNDWAQGYPSAGAGIQFEIGSLRFASMFRVVRIAGGSGSGDYWLTWSPLRVGFRL